MIRVFAIQVGESDMDTTEVLFCYGSKEKRFVEERPHGEWIVTGKKNVLGGFEIQCPYCLTKLIVSRGRYEIGENYCDVCGAKMKKPWVGEAE